MDKNTIIEKLAKEIAKQKKLSDKLDAALEMFK